MSFRGLAGRVTVVVALVTASSAGLASPASAHVTVTADKAQAGATDVTVSFDAEAESTTAGIVTLQVVLPTGIVPAGVTWVSGPLYWKLTPTSDGYDVGGPPVPVGMNAAYKVKIDKLPTNTRTLAFKTYENYSDGTVDRWIAIPSAGAAEPDHPAPVLTLAPETSEVANPATTDPQLVTGVVVVAALAAIIGVVLGVRRWRGGNGRTDPT